jgi:uncharacterized protein (DUF58 family)
MSLLFRVVYLFYRIFSGLRYRVRRRLTRPGLAIFGAMIVAAFMGPDTENNVAYQGFTPLLFLLLLAVAFSFVFRGRFSAIRLLPRFGTVGAPLSYQVAVTNLTAKTQTGLTVLENLAEPRPVFHDWLAVQRAEDKRSRSFRLSRRRRRNSFRMATLKEAILPPTQPNQQQTTNLELTPLRRGVLRLGGLTLARPDPLGLFRAFIKVVLPQSILILPKRYVLPPIALPGTAKYQQGGVALASSVGQSEEFVALRDYRDGDPLRHIHWRSWAKAGKPVVKEFEDEFFVRHALVLDTFIDHPHGEAFEEAVSLAASFVCTVQTQESLLDLMFIGPDSYRFTSGRGLAHADQMLEILAGVRVCRERSFAALELLVLNHISVVSGCICVLLAWDEARRGFIQKIRALGIPALVLVVVDPGKDKALEPGPMQDDPDHFGVLEAGQIERDLARLNLN